MSVGRATAKTTQDSIEMKIEVCIELGVGTRVLNE